MKTTNLSLLSFFLLFYISAFSQPLYSGIESKGVRCDPEWTAAYKSEGVFIPASIISDEKGNTYSAGYYNRTLQLADKRILYDKNYAFRSFFLLKHNSNGTLVWACTAKKDVVPSDLAFDKEGNILITGHIANNTVFYSPDSTVHDTLNITETEGAFLCKYDTAGTPLFSEFISVGRETYVNAIAVDNKNSIYLGGTYGFRYADKRAEQQKSYMFLKLDKSGSVSWKIKGDTLGTSSINDIACDADNNIIATGSFKKKVTFSRRELKSDEDVSNAFVVKYTDAAKIKWAIQSDGKYGHNSGESVVVDSKKNIIINGIYSYRLLFSHQEKPQTEIKGQKGKDLFIAKFDEDGQTQWIQSAISDYDEKAEQVIIDKADNIYLCGESTGCLFTSSGNMVLSFKAKSGSDFFLAKYASSGDLQWMKTADSKGPGYGKSLTADNAGNIYLLGMYSTNLQFDNTELTKSGSYVLIVKFSKEALENMLDIIINETVTSSTQEKKNFADCACENTSKSDPAFVPSLKGLLPEETMSALSELPFYMKEDFYKHIFYKDYVFNVSSSSTFQKLTLLTYAPVMLEMKNGSFTLNLTPCTIEKHKFTELPFTLDYTHDALSYIPGFDAEKFGETAYEYFDILRHISGAESEDLLSKALFDMEPVDVQEIANNINARYDLKIQLKEKNTILDSIISQLETKFIYISDVVFSEFVEDATNKGKITEDEFSNLAHLFSDYLNNISIEGIQSIIYPQIKASVQIKKVGILLDTAILRTWDEVEKTAYRNEAGEMETPQMVFDVKNIEYSTARGLEIEPSAVCAPRSEIASTGILLDFNAAIIDADETTNPSKISYTDQPFFTYYDTVQAASMFYSPDFGLQYIRGDSTKVIKERYDPLLEQFTGLFVNNGEMFFPENEIYKKISAHDILINNSFISGVIYLRDLPFTSISPSDFIKLMQQKGFEILQKKAMGDISALYFLYKAK